MKSIHLWMAGAVVVIIAGIWLVTSRAPEQPETSASPSTEETLTPMPTPTPTPTPKVTMNTATPKPVSTHTPTPTPAPANIDPVISSVTVTAPTDEVSSWTAVMNGGVPSAPSGQCYQIVPPSFYIDGTTYYITLKATLTSSATACMYNFTQTIQLGNTSTAPGLHSIYVNGAAGTSYIVSEPTPTPTP